MRISVSSDMDEPVARGLVEELRDRGHEVLLHGALRAGDDDRWAVCSEAAAREVAEGRADQAVVCCWTGTGASIAANKVPGVRAALCTDAYTAGGARRWNDANVLALSLRLTSGPLLREILDAWFAAEASAEADDRQNVAHVGRIGDIGRIGPTGPIGRIGREGAAP
ncbi:RpiB/LacA/LacB family sugar-phosphate isomerase [Streptomyces sp. NPDC096198]|uniref:RpiB/LacA/LacB family sugar-phosphate isomerase n=1 Tax=Streptomyces sp. NPDC096198 TaxID=3366080 RepID=UPI003829674E